MMSTMISETRMTLQSLSIPPIVRYSHCNRYVSTSCIVSMLVGSFSGQSMPSESLFYHWNGAGPSTFSKPHHQPIFPNDNPTRYSAEV